MNRDVTRAVAARDAATARVRRLTVALVAVGTALTAAFSSLAAGSTHVAKTTRTARRPVVHAPRPKPVVAPAPPLVGDRSRVPAPPPQPAPAPTPAPATTAPVVVSGGS